MASTMEKIEGKLPTAKLIEPPTIKEISAALLEDIKAVDDDDLMDYTANCEIDGFRYSLPCSDAICWDSSQSHRQQVEDNLKFLVRSDLDVEHQIFYIYDGALLREQLEYFFDDGTAVHQDMVEDAMAIHSLIFERLQFLGVNVDRATIGIEASHRITLDDGWIFAKVENPSDTSDAYFLVLDAVSLFDKLIKELGNE